MGVKNKSPFQAQLCHAWSSLPLPKDVQSEVPAFAGVHILQCSHGSERIVRHNHIRDVVAAIARDFRLHVTVEHHDVFPPWKGNTPWKRVPHWQWADIRALWDVVVANPTYGYVMLCVRHLAEGGGLCDVLPWGPVLPICVGGMGLFIQSLIISYRLGQFIVSSGCVIPWFSIITTFFRQWVSITLQRA